MGVIRKLEVIEPATQELVKEFATRSKCPGDRPLSKSRVTHLREAIRSGNFLMPHWARGIVGADVYRINGKHSSVALLNEGVPPGLKISIQTFWCDSTHDLARLYAGFDSSFSTRRAGDLTSASAASCPSLEGVPIRRVMNYVAGKTIALNDGNNANITPTDRHRIVTEDAAVIRAISDGLGATKEVTAATLGFRNLERVSVFAAIYRTFAVHGENCLPFWKEVREECHPQYSSPSRYLARFLTGAKSGSSRSGNLVSNREVMCRSIYAFNTWACGRTIQITKYYADKPSPTVAPVIRPGVVEASQEMLRKHLEGMEACNLPFDDEPDITQAETA